MPTILLDPSFTFQPRKPIRYKTRVPQPAAPTPPPAPANVISTAYGSDGMGGGWATLTFDQPVTLVGSPVIDGSITLASIWPSSVSQDGPNTLRFLTSIAMYTGAIWNVNAQPGYVTEAVNSPQAGYF